MGHRGGFKPENTLLAFYQAKMNKLRAIELDVCKIYIIIMLIGLDYKRWPDCSHSWRIKWIVTVSR
jgi:hypothetical protein